MHKERNMMKCTGPGAKREGKDGKKLKGREKEKRKKRERDGQREKYEGTKE